MEQFRLTSKTLCLEKGEVERAQLKAEKEAAQKRVTEQSSRIAEQSSRIAELERMLSEKQ